MADSHPQFRNAQGEPLTLLLYMFDGCPFCQRVLDQAKKQNLTLPMRDIHRDAQAQSELVRVGGKKTVPCLFINGEPLYESADIVAFLQTQVQAA